MFSRLGVRGRLLLSFFGISGFAVLAAAAAMYSFLQVDRSLDRITETEVPAVLLSREVSRQAERIAAVGPALLSLTTFEEHDELSAQIANDVKRLKALLTDLKGRAVEPAELEALEPLVNWLDLNLISMDTLVANNLAILERKTELLDDLSDTYTAIRRDLGPKLVLVESEIVAAEQLRTAPDLTLEQRLTAMTEKIGSMGSLLRAEAAFVEFSIAHDVLRIATLAERPTELELIKVQLDQLLDGLATTVQRLGLDVRPELQESLERFRDLVGGPASILRLRERELKHIEAFERQVNENTELSRNLIEAVDQVVGRANQGIASANFEARSAQNVSAGILLTVVALSLTSSVLIVWLYVGRNLIARLSALNSSMLAIAGGHLDASVPTGGSDEISRMADALTVFRDTAIEVKETNMREIRAARQRLEDAIESISEGFSLHDAEDRLVVCNSRYRALNPGTDEAAEQKLPFETIIRRAAERGDIEDAKGRVDEWVAERLAQHSDPAEPHLQHRADDRWVQVSERRTKDAGTVAVYTDITPLKRAEEALREKSEFLQLNQIITRAANEAANVDEAMQIALDEVCAYTKWPVGHVYMLDKAEGDLAPSGIWHLDDAKQFETFRSVTEATRFASGIGLQGRVLASGQPAWIFDVTTDPNFLRAQLASDIGVKGAFAFPVLVGRKVFAVIEFFSDKPAEPYEPLLEVMAQIGTQLGRVIERKQATDRANAELTRIEEELQSARELQLAMVPSQFSPPTPERPLKFAAEMHPAREVGGDFYDVIEIDEHRMGVVIADVSGKGAGAALFMARACTILNATAKRGGGPGAVLAQLNDVMCVRNQKIMFVTAFYGVFDPRTGLLTFANAGHNPPFVLRSDRSVEQLAITGGVPVGIKPNFSYPEISVELGPGDTLFCYTDGITEAKNATKEEFSETNLAMALRDSGQIAVDDLAGHVIDKVNEFTDHAPPFDDMTCVVMQCASGERVSNTGEPPIKISNDVEQLHIVNQRVNAFAERKELPGEVASVIKLVLEELLTNTISYGYADEGTHTIEVHLDLQNDQLCVEIIDDAEAFDLRNAKEPDTTSELKHRPLRGRGIHLIRNLMDSIEYRREGRRNHYVLTKNIEYQE